MSKAITRSALILLLISFGLGLDAKVTISKIEYFPGEDFVQLHMQTDKILPIPDIFYPEKDNLKRLVMRVKDAEFRVASPVMAFDSPVVQGLKVQPGADYADVEILLKGEANYRVFTNQTGLYIEFPVLKGLAAVPAPPVLPAPAPRAAQPAADEAVSLRDVRLASQEPGHIRFELALSRETEYHVIPIEQEPVRLAIDLKNAQSRRISKTVNLQNVRGIRGGNNSSGVYRVVFDLSYLKHFAVQAKGSVLQVEFFDGPQAEAAPPALAASPAAPVASAAAESAPPAAAGESQAQPAAREAAPPAPAAENPARLQPARAFFGPEKSKAEEETAQATAPAAKPAADIDFQKKTVDEGRPQYSGEPYDFSFKNADISNILKFIAKVSGLNMVINPNVTGKFTCELVQVPWDQALEIMLKVNGLDMIQEGNILRIGRVEDLAQEAKRRQELREAREQEGNLEVSTRTLSYAKVKDVQAILKKQMSPRGELVIDDRTNTLIISEVPERIKVIDGLIDTLDAANPQVQIEARIVETSSESLNTFGIQWGLSGVANSSYGNQTNLVFPNSVNFGGVVETKTNPMGYIVNVPTADSVVFPKLSLGNIAGTFNLDMALSALTSKGKARIISSPRAVTQNNMPAEITQGERIPIQTNQNNTITTQYINAALELKITPQITARGSVIMLVDIKNDIADFSKPVNGMPTIKTETAKTTVMVNDGGTIVLGGLYKINEDHSNTGVPVLSKIPLLGSLFRNSRRYGKTQELMIFITPRIIK